MTGKTIGQYRQLLQRLKAAVFAATRRRLQPRRARHSSYRKVMGIGFLPSACALQFPSWSSASKHLSVHSLHEGRAACQLGAAERGAAPPSRK